MTIAEGFNIHGILIGIAFIIYFGYIGRALKAKLSWIKIPAIITGFVSTMFVWSILFLGVHINPVADYKFLFILYIALTLGLASIAKPWVGFKLDRTLTTYVVLAVIGTVVTGALMHELHTSLITDNWLYMKWMSDASKFMSEGLGEHLGLEYGLSSFYRFIGSFFGMFGTTLEYVEGGYKDIRVFAPVYQTGTTIITAAITAELIKFFINDKRYHLMMPGYLLAYWFVGTYGVTMVGSILLWIPSAYLFALIYRKEYDQKNIILISLPFMMFTSSVFMIFAGFVVMNSYFSKDDKPWANLVFAAAMLAKYITGLTILDDIVYHFLLVSIFFIGFYLFFAPIKKVVSKIVWFISMKPLWTQWILFVLIIVYNFMDLQNATLEQRGSLLRRGILLKFVMVALFIEWKRNHKELFIAFCLMAILNLPYMEIVNWLSNHELDGIMHRFGQLLLMGDKYSIVHWAYLIPVFGWFILKETINGKSEK